MSVSEQLHTYLSPNQTTVNQYHIRVNVGLGEGLRCAVVQILMSIPITHTNIKLRLHLHLNVDVIHSNPITEPKKRHQNHHK